ncbi:hypothetical protein HDU96_001484, partial [Phlyctochytrium bullatum]
KLVAVQVQTSMVQLAQLHWFRAQPLIEAAEAPHPNLMAQFNADQAARARRRECRNQRRTVVKEIRGRRFRHDNAVSWFERQLAARKARNAAAVADENQNRESDELPDPNQSVQEMEDIIRDHGRNEHFFGASVEEMLAFVRTEMEVFEQ